MHALVTSPVINGTPAGHESFYGAARSVQNTRTQCGDSVNGDPRIADVGSELDQVFAVVSGGRLNVLITGNLEDNFNRLEVFIDSTPGGVNTINGDALPRGV